MMYSLSSHKETFTSTFEGTNIFLNNLVLFIYYVTILREKLQSHDGFFFTASPIHLDSSYDISYFLLIGDLTNNTLNTYHLYFRIFKVYVF